MPRPVIGIAANVDDQNATVRRRYIDAVASAGGLPLVLTPIAGDDAQAYEAAKQAVALCDGIVLTGGDDPRTEAYGTPTHPAAKPLHPDRQRFDEAILRAIDELADRGERDTPTLGVCLGMQMMALAAGGELNQHLPDDTPTADNHRDNRLHPVRAITDAPFLSAQSGEVLGEVASWHHQGVRSPGRLRVIAVADDGVIEAIDDPARRFYLGVQWHPERTAAARTGLDVFRALVRAST